MRSIQAFLSIACFVANLAVAATIEATLEFSQNDFNFTQIIYDSVTYDYITPKGVGTDLNMPGQPQVPMSAGGFSLPFGSTVTAVEVINSTSQELGEYYLYPGQKPRFVGDDYDADAWEFTPPDPAIYDSPDPFPPANVTDRGAAPSRGYLTTDFVVYPLQWKPKTRKLKLYTSMTVRVTYTPPLSTPEPTRHEWPDIYNAWGEEVKSRVLNPADVIANRESVIPVDVMEWGEDTEGDVVIPWVRPHTSSYYEYNVPQAVDGFPGVADPCYPFRYIAVTNEKWWKNDSESVDQGGMEMALQPFWEWKMRNGTGLHIVMLDDIVNSSVPGADKQEKLRNWMKACYTNWGTEAFFLVGDTAKLNGTYAENWETAGRYGVVPSRYLTSSEPTEYDDPTCTSDLYYTILQGSWGPQNIGGVRYYGVNTYHPPFYPDVWVGRLPAGSPVEGEGAAEVSAYVTKLLKYEITPPDGLP